jgi:hypothetical protein
VIGINRCAHPGAPAPLDPWQRDVPCVDAPTFKDVPRSVHSQFDHCPISMQFKQSAAVESATGESLRAICSEAGMPGRATVFRWIARHKEFRDEYSLACELRAEDLADEMIEIADDPWVWVEKIGADGRAVRVLDHENLAGVRLKDEGPGAAGRADGAEKIRQPALKTIRAQPRVGISYYQAQ